MTKWIHIVTSYEFVGDLHDYDYVAQKVLELTPSVQTDGAKFNSKGRNR